MPHSLELIGQHGFKIPFRCEVLWPEFNHRHIELPCPFGDIGARFVGDTQGHLRIYYAVGASLGESFKVEPLPLANIANFFSFYGHAVSFNHFSYYRCLFSGF